MPVIDVHVHLYPERRLGGLMRWIHKGIPGHPVPVDITVEAVVADLRAAGVERFLAAVFPLAPGEARELNRFNADLAKDLPEMIPLGTVHPEDPDPGAAARKAIEVLGLKGIKLHPMMMGMDVCDPRLMPVYALLQEAGRPLLAHTGFEEGCDQAGRRGDWERLFRDFPRLTILLAHMFFPDLPYAFSLLSRFGNVVLDATNVFGMMLWPDGPLPFGISRPRWSREELVAAIEAHPDRVVFGSDHPAGMGTLEEVIRQVETFGLAEDTVHRILYGNARALLARLGL
jgi:uncharacterized protein